MLDVVRLSQNDKNKVYGKITGLKDKQICQYQLRPTSSAVIQG
jgi:hypothetical protein